MQMKQSDPAFLSRWLHGKLSQDELASMRNREDYEEMLQESEKNDSGTRPEKQRGASDKKNGKTEKPGSDQSSFHKFVAVTTMLAFGSWLALKVLTNIL